MELQVKKISEDLKILKKAKFWQTNQNSDKQIKMPTTQFTKQKKWFKSLEAQAEL